METEESNKPKWLIDTQQRSWEPEILLSGIVLFGLFQIPELLDELALMYKKEISNQYTDINNFVAISKVSVFWLVLGLVVHLVARGIWVGLIGLNAHILDLFQNLTLTK